MLLYPYHITKADPINYWSIMSLRTFNLESPAYVVLFWGGHANPSKGSNTSLFLLQRYSLHSKSRPLMWGEKQDGPQWGVEVKFQTLPSPLSSRRSSAVEWPALSKSNRAKAKGDDSVDTGSLLVGKHLRNIWLLKLFTPSSSRPGRNKAINLWILSWAFSLSWLHSSF